MRFYSLATTVLVVLPALFLPALFLPGAAVAAEAKGASDPAPATASVDPKTGTITVETPEQAKALGLQAAQRLIQEKKYPEALSVLAQLDQAFPADSQIEFLVGMVAMAQGDYRAAQAKFRRILVREPKATRVRLELARTYYLEGDDANAKFHFRLALSGDLPPTVVRNIETYLQAIRRRRLWDFGMSFGVAPDTNINTAPTLRDITIFGLPFELNEDAQAQSGIGFYVGANGEYRQPVNDWLQGRIGARFTRNEYEGGDFDDMTLSSFAGPRILIGEWDVSVLATGYRRWYGNEPYSDAGGGRLEAERQFTPRLNLQGSFQGLYVNYHDNESQDGKLWSLSFSGTYGLTPNSFARALVFGSLEDTKLATTSNQSVGAGIGYYRELPFGFSIYAQPQAIYTWYDAATAAFGVKREEWLAQVRLNLLNRKLDLGGFTPTIGYVYQWQRSNIDLYNFNRNRVEIGFTRQF